jgi:hypothetical protein
MAEVASALALETAVLTYLVVEFGEDKLRIPDSVNMSSSAPAGDGMVIGAFKTSISSAVLKKRDLTAQ